MAFHVGIGPLPEKLQDLSPAQARFCLSVRRFIESELGLNLVNQRLLAAFSGGADSTALLLVLQYLSRSMGFALAATHLDHNIRPSSVAEAEHCRTLCSSLGIPFFTAAADIPDLHSRTGQGHEECGRKARHALYHAAALHFTAHIIATGHTLNDLAEDILMRLIRGTGWPGLAGMAATTTLFSVDDIYSSALTITLASPALAPSAIFAHTVSDRGGLPTVVRPLLMTSRHAIETFLRSLNVPWIEDESNHDPRYTRNRVRSRLLPVILEENSNFLAKAAGLWKLGQLDSEWFETLFPKETDDKPTTVFLSKEYLVQQPQAFRLRVYKRCLDQLGPGQALLTTLLAVDASWLNIVKTLGSPRTHRFPGGKTATIAMHGISWSR